jgi:alpha-L-fucosidase
MDWRDPDCRTERNATFVAAMQGELRELLSLYGEIAVLWFDTDGRSAPWNQPETYQLVRTLQPRIIINDRLDRGSKPDYDARIIEQNADYYTPEQRIGGFDNQRPWETCMTLGTQWAWKPNDAIKSLKQCIDILVRCAGGDGNLLLNVGPMPTGEIEPRQVERLKEMGQWLAKYGETIYSTRGGPWRPGPWGAATCKGNTVYVHVLQWPADTIALPALRRKIVSNKVLTGGTASVKQTDGGVEISVPAADRQEIDTLVALELDGPAFDAGIVSGGASAARARFPSRGTTTSARSSTPSGSAATNGSLSPAPPAPRGAASSRT